MDLTGDILLKINSQSQVKLHTQQFPDHIGIDDAWW